MATRRDDPPVLVIEHDEEIRYSLTLMLIERGYEALSVPTPEKAVELLGRGLRPGVIVLDPVTPSDAGDFQSRLAASPAWSKIELIIGPGAAHRDDSVRARAPGQPLNLRELLGALGFGRAPASRFAGPISRG